jgi:signal recognition particle subunit SRP54
MKSLLGMIPGIGHQLKDMDLDEKQIDRTEAIIKSMTPAERKDVNLLDNSRRRRIARGSGTQPQDVSQLVKGFTAVQQMSKQISGMGMMSRMKALTGMGNMDLAALGGGRGLPQLPGLGPKSNRPHFRERKRRSR